VSYSSTMTAGADNPLPTPTAEQSRETVREPEASLDYLRALCPRGADVYYRIRHVSRSGMTLHIALYVIASDRQSGRPYIVQLPPSRIERVTGFSTTRDGTATVVTGCGMDMGWDLVYRLALCLYPGSTESDLPFTACKL
jgi:hypothetical protein